MKLSANTVEILKNYATINPSILVREGNILSTCSPQKSIFARATVAETFSQQFAIYELNKFLGVVSLFNEPELKVSDKRITINSDNQQLSYTCADPSMIIAPPEKELNFPTAEIEFEVKQEDLQKVIRAGSVLQLPEISVIGKEGKISIAATNGKDPTSDQYSVEITDTHLNFNMIFKADNIIKLISSNYNVKISSKLISKFTSASGVNIYYIAAEKDSKFGE